MTRCGNPCVLIEANTRFSSDSALRTLLFLVDGAWTIVTGSSLRGRGTAGTVFTDFQPVIWGKYSICFVGNIQNMGTWKSVVGAKPTRASSEIARYSEGTGFRRNSKLFRCFELKSLQTQNLSLLFNILNIYRCIAVGRRWFLGLP